MYILLRVYITTSKTDILSYSSNSRDFPQRAHNEHIFTKTKKGDISTYIYLK